MAWQGAMAGLYNLAREEQETTTLGDGFYVARAYA